MSYNHMSTLREDPSHPSPMAITAVGQNHFCSAKGNPAEGLAAPHASHRNEVTGQSGQSYRIVDPPADAQGPGFLNGGGIDNSPLASAHFQSLGPFHVPPQNAAQVLQPVGRSAQSLEQGDIREAGPAEGFGSGDRLPQRQSARHVQQDQPQQSFGTVDVARSPQSAALARALLPIGWQHAFHKIPILSDEFVAHMRDNINYINLSMQYKVSAYAIGWGEGWGERRLRACVQPQPRARRSEHRSSSRRAHHSNTPALQHSTNP